MNHRMLCVRAHIVVGSAIHVYLCAMGHLFVRLAFVFHGSFDTRVLFLTSRHPFSSAPHQAARQRAAAVIASTKARKEKKVRAQSC